MQTRNLLVLLFFFAIFLLIQDFNPINETYVGMQMQTVGGRPVLVLVEQDAFSIYELKDKAAEGWHPVLASHYGRIYGGFSLGQQAGFFFRKRSVLYDISKPDTTRVSTPLEFDWQPETSAVLDGKLYAFGALVDVNKPTEGVLKTAQFVDGKWDEVPKAEFNDFHFGKLGFWITALPCNGKIAVIWRSLRWDQTVGADVEGMRLATEGETYFTYFDGSNFTKPAVLVKGLPAGNMSIWEEQGKLKFLIQTRVGKNVEPEKGRMEIWDVAEDGSSKLNESIGSKRNRLGLFPFIAAEHFVRGGREYILRSTWQKFEVWEKADDGQWRVLPGAESRLPVFALENYLLIALIVCLLVVLFGAVLAFQRRRQALTLLKKLQPTDLYAPLLPRGGAYVLDLILVIAVSYFVKKFTLDINTYEIPEFFEFTFVLCYLTYFVGFECLCSATPGKFAMGLRTVMDEGKRPTFWAALVRNTTGLFERYPLSLLVCIPMLIISPRRQRMGDLFSQTYVVQKRGLELFLKQKKEREMLAAQDEQNSNVLTKMAFMQRQEIKPRLILASASPRRSQIFSDAGYAVEIIEPGDAEEAVGSAPTPELLAVAKARAKALAVAGKLRGPFPALVIGADTLVSAQGKVIGKPVDRADATAILTSLSGTRHCVISGVSVVPVFAHGPDESRALNFFECTWVTMRRVEADEIAAYVATGECDGKAGAYAIQEEGDKFVERLEGAFSNVVGFPIERFETEMAKALKGWGF